MDSNIKRSIILENYQDANNRGIPDKDGYIPFLAVAPSNGRVLPFQRKQDSNKIEKVFKTISLPQMVDNKETRTTMNKNLGELLHSRFNHHLKRYLGENTK